jgi:hypothetical protein
MKSFLAIPWPTLVLGSLLLGCAHHQETTTTCTEHPCPWPPCRATDQAVALAPGAGKPSACLACRPQAPVLIPPLDQPAAAKVTSPPAGTKAAKPSPAGAEWVKVPLPPAPPGVVNAPAAAPDGAGAGSSAPVVKAPPPAPPAADPLAWALVEPPPLPAHLARGRFAHEVAAPEAAAAIPQDGTRPPSPSPERPAQPSILPRAEDAAPVVTDSLPAQPAGGERPEERAKSEPEHLPPPAPVAPAVPAPPPAAAPVTSSGPGHARDYAWLIGTLEYAQAKKVWMVRYAGPDEVDVYGGSVTLVEKEHAEMEGFKPGQKVRVEGHFADREPNGWCPRYQVDSIRPLP